MEAGGKLCGGSGDERLKHWGHIHLQLHALKNWISLLGVQRSVQNSSPRLLHLNLASESHVEA